MAERGRDGAALLYGSSAVELLVTGTPGPLLSSVVALIEAAAEADGHATVHVPIDDQIAWTGPLLPAGSGLRLYQTNALSGTFAQAVTEGQLRAITVIDDPASCMAALMQAGNTPHQAAFALSAAAAPLGMLVALDTVTVLLPHTALAGAVMSIRRTTGAKPADPAPLVVPPGSTGQDPGTPLASLHPVGPPPALTADAQALVDQVITPLFEEAATGRRQTITWSRTCLFWGDQPGEPVPRIIDLAGPGRVLAYGPYFHLPRGGWTVRAVLAFSSTAIGVPLAVELHGDGLLGRGRLTPGQAGVFAASFPADVGSPAIPIEVRVISEAGAIDGKIGVDHVALIPRP